MWEHDGKMYHTRIDKGSVGRYVLLPGDPFRTDKMATFLEDAELIAHNREHKTWTGRLCGERVTITSTGMGCPSTAIAMEELIACGARTFIRVGTAGCLCPEKRKEGAMVGIVTAAVRDEGTTRQYVPVEYPAVSDRHVVEALAKSAEKLGVAFDEGITLTKDSLFSFVYPETIPYGDLYKERNKIWPRSNVLLSEMEAAAVLVISSIRSCRAAGIMAYSDTEDPDKGMDQAILTACGAIELLIAQDSK